MVHFSVVWWTKSDEMRREKRAILMPLVLEDNIEDEEEEEASLTKHEKRTLSVFGFNFSRVALRLKFRRSVLLSVRSL